MALESTSVISGLVVTNPVASDNRSQGDDHLRLIKTVLLAGGKCATLEWSTDTTTAVTAVAGQGYICTNVAAVTVTLPASPSIGQEVAAVFTNGLATNVFGRNGNPIGSTAEDCTINSTAVVPWTFRYLDSTRGWVLA
jgi:hypothetical protein